MAVRRLRVLALVVLVVRSRLLQVQPALLPRQRQREPPVLYRLPSVRVVLPVAQISDLPAVRSRSFPQPVVLVARQPLVKTHRSLRSLRLPVAWRDPRQVPAASVVDLHSLVVSAVPPQQVLAPVVKAAVSRLPMEPVELRLRQVRAVTAERSLSQPVQVA